MTINVLPDFLGNLIGRLVVMDVGVLGARSLHAGTIRQGGTLSVVVLDRKGGSFALFKILEVERLHGALVVVLNGRDGGGLALLRFLEIPFLQEGAETERHGADFRPCAGSVGEFEGVKMRWWVGRIKCG